MRFNLIGFCGFVLSLSSGILFLGLTQISLFGMTGTSMDSALRQDIMWDATRLTMLLFVGIGISALTPLGWLVQLPSLAILLPMSWYLGFTCWTFVPAFSACFILILSMFVGLEYPGSKLSIPPRSRKFLWHVRDDGTTSRPFSEFARRAITLAIVGSVIVLASFTFYVGSNDVSQLQVSVYVDGATYGSVGFTVYLDGEAMHSGTLTYDGEHYAMYEPVNLRLSSGSHTLELDVWNGSASLPVGDIDSVAYVRTLPFSEDTVYLLLGVYVI
ncbi:MAG: hypothetical protein MUE55_08175 [Thermoplasmata archaeon]|nr:hypothetical protein [Thermoplasmata archaeon]